MFGVSSGLREIFNFSRLLRPLLGNRLRNWNGSFMVKLKFLSYDSELEIELETLYEEVFLVPLRMKIKNERTTISQGDYSYI